MSEDSGEKLDAILLYNSRDVALAEGVFTRLDGRCRVWFAPRSLRPDAPIALSINEAMARSRAVLLCIGPHDLGNYQSWEASAALNEAINKRRRLLPIYLPGSNPDKLNMPMIQDMSPIDLREEANHVLAYEKLIAQVLEGSEPKEPPDPDGPLVFDYEDDGEAPLRELSISATQQGLTIFVGGTLPERTAGRLLNPPRLGADLLARLGLVAKDTHDTLVCTPRATYLYWLSRGEDSTGMELEGRIGASSIGEPAEYTALAAFLANIRTLPCFTPTSMRAPRLVVVTTNLDFSLERAFLRSRVPFTRVLFKRSDGSLRAVPFTEIRSTAGGHVEMGTGDSRLVERTADQLGVDELNARRRQFDESGLRALDIRFDVFLATAELNGIIRRHSERAAVDVPKDDAALATKLDGFPTPVLVKLFGSYEDRRGYAIATHHYYEIARRAYDFPRSLSNAIGHQAALLVGFHLVEPHFVHLFETWLRTPFTQDANGQQHVAIIPPHLGRADVPGAILDAQDHIDRLIGPKLWGGAAMAQWGIRPCGLPVARALEILGARLVADGENRWPI